MLVFIDTNILPDFYRIDSGQAPGRGHVHDCSRPAFYGLHRLAALTDDHERCPEHGMGEVVFAVGLHHSQH